MYDTGASAHGAGPTDEPNAPYAGGGAETYSMAPGPQLPDWQAHRTLALTLTLTLPKDELFAPTMTLRVRDVRALPGGVVLGRRAHPNPHHNHNPNPNPNPHPKP